MALIICPECNKEISDKVKSCPHCGYPIAEDVSSTHEPIKVNVTSINLNQPNKEKIRKLVFRGLIFISIISCIIAFLAHQNAQKATKVRNNYIVNLNLISSTMLSGASDAEQLCNLTAKVWRNTIFKENDSETGYYTHSWNGLYNSDFNTSIAKLFEDTTIKNKVKSIELNQALASSFMKDLRNPSLEFEKCYNTLNEMFNIFMGLTDLAISPNGSLQTFIQNKGEKVDKFMGYYRMLKTQIPEKR